MISNPHSIVAFMTNSDVWKGRGVVLQEQMNTVSQFSCLFLAISMHSHLNSPAEVEDSFKMIFLKSS